MKFLPKAMMLVILLPTIAYSQTLINTSFEEYSDGSVFGQGDWIEGDDNDGSAEITTSTDNVRSGTKGLRISTSTAVTSMVDYEPFGNDNPGYSSNVYIDFWVKMIIPPVGESVYLRVFDHLPDDGIRRACEIRMYPEGDITVSDGGSKRDVPSELFIVGEWIRISLSVDYATWKYQAAINGTVLQNNAEEGEFFDFRESYDAADKGRASGIKEFHGLRFWYEDAIGEIAVDDIYIGTDIIADVNFTAPSNDRTITLEQPDKATITLNPQKEIYEVGDVVMATITDIADHYIFNGWTGSYSGTDNPLTINVSGNVLLGADIIIDESDPPQEYTITINQPTGGNITVDPSTGPYYEGETVEFTVTPDIGFKFDSWTGISDTLATVEVEMTQDLTVSAVLVESTSEERVINVSNNSELEDAMEDMLPGDRIIVADGTYAAFRETIENKGGTATYPVIIEAANQGMAKFTGETRFFLEQSAYITFSGFEFDVAIYTLFKLTGCNNIRLTRNIFKNAGDDGSKLIIIGDEWQGEVATSHHNRIDHNLFDGKADGGAWVVIDGTHGTVPQVSQYDRIDYNHFRFNGPRVSNEKETIRVGLSDLSLSSAFCTIEYNLFEECDGDPEIISIKANDNYVRNNTFFRSLGTVSLRHGNRSEISGNFFIGDGKTAEFNGGTIGCGGVRIYGKDHVVFNNYFEGLTGYRYDAAITLTQGDASNDNVTQSSNLTKHYVIENLEVSHNTLINNFSDIEIGYRDDWGKAPKNVLIANNIIVQDANPVTTVHHAGTESDITFADNIIYTSGSGSWGDLNFTSDQAVDADPLLEMTDCKIPGVNCTDEYANAFFKISSSNSPALDPTPANTIEEATLDIEGQEIKGTRDLGADEYNSSGIIISGMLDARHVGPDAIPFSWSEEGEEEEEEPLAIGDELRVKLIKAYPNPFENIITMESELPASVVIYKTDGGVVDSFQVMGSVRWSAPAPGLYFAQISSKGGQQVLKLISF